LFVRTVCARAYPRLILNVREKWWLVFDIALPLVGLCAYIFMYRANDAPPELRLRHHRRRGHARMNVRGRPTSSSGKGD
jgi:hypothetical protein